MCRCKPNFVAAEVTRLKLKNRKSEISQSLLTSAATIESCLHAIERIPSAGRGQPAQFVPIRFIYRNKLIKDDKLLLAFDAFVLSEMLGRPVSLGKLIHGDDHATLKVKTPALAGEVRKRLGIITALLGKRQRDKREKYHHALKALAIREQKIHIVGSPELKIEGTPVYLDVEGLPDRDFCFVISLYRSHEYSKFVKKDYA
jgi:hypothetical protein